MNREIRNALNSKAPKRVLSNIKPAKREGSDGEERIAKANGGVRLYRKELGQWWYTQFQQSDKADSSSVGVATSTTLGSVIVGSGLSITGGGTLSLTSAGANYYLDGITKSSNTLTFSVNGATNQDYTFGSNAFNSTTIPTNTNQLTNGAGFLTAVATANIADEAVTLAKLAHVATDVFLGRTTNGTGDVEAMSVSDVTTLLSLDDYLTSISTLNADKLTAGTIPDARVPASAVTQHVASIVHDSLSGFVANEHLDWTVNVGTIHAGNYTDTNTNQLTKFYFVDDDGDAVHPSHNHYIKFMNGNGITTNWNALDSAGTSGDPHILTITNTGNSGTVTAVGTSGSITGGTITSTGTITHLTSAGHTHVPTTASQSGKFLKAVTDYGGSEAWATLTEADISDLGTYLTSSQAQSAYLTKSSPTLTADTTLSMNNARISARTSAGGGSDGLGTAGQVLHSHANGGGVYWATVADDMQWILEDHSGDQVTVADGKYVKFVAGTGLNINWNGGTGAVDNEYDLDFTISGYNNSNWDTAYGWGNHASGGYLTGITGQAIGSLSNVDSSSPSNGQILKYNTGSSSWVVSNNTVTIGSINDITDVSITGTTDNYILMYENATGRWKNEPTTDITSVGTIGTGVWNASVIASAKLDADTAHLSEAQTFSGAKTFSANAVFNGEVLVNNTSSGNAKLYIKGGGTSTANSLYITDSAGADILYVKDNKSAKFYGTLETVGNATFGGDVTISSGKGLIVSWAEGTNSGSYISQFSNLDSTNNQSNGVLIQAGAGASDKALAVRNYAGTDMFIVKGDSSATFAGFLNDTKIYNHLKFVNSDGTTVNGGIRGAGNSVEIRTGASTTVACTFDGSQDATFAGDVTLLGASSYARDLTFAHGASNYYWRMGYTSTSNGNSLAFINRDGGSEQEVMRMDWNKNTTFAGQIINTGDCSFRNGEILMANDRFDVLGGQDRRITLGTIGTPGQNSSHNVRGRSDGLYLNAPSKIVCEINGSAKLTLTSAGDCTFGGRLYITDGSGSYPSYCFSSDSNTGMYLGASDTLRFATGGAERLEIQSTQTKVTGNFKATGDVIAYASSDPILKDNAKLIENPLNKLSKINGYTFDWNKKATEIGKHLTGHDYGVMANEIQDVMPELVQTRENGIQAVNYEKIIPLLIECIKEQQTQINELKGIA